MDSEFEFQFPICLKITKHFHVLVVIEKASFGALVTAPSFYQCKSA